MDYGSNYGNINKILRLLNLLGATEVLPAYLVSKEGQNLLYGIRATPAPTFPQPSLFVHVRRRRHLHCLHRQ
jgi:hypothetical protein